MSYLVLARKWRPRRFAELVGQTHVVRALTNALQSGRVHHAFLFTGTRGVGKTTIARIFAKSLNCEHGPSAEPCGECGACRDIDAGRYVDLLEIDAASHTGVDNVRDLIDNAQYLPARGRTKVYLIDEVHMLSKPAFNALLKTLEEPPAHVKFLLATTDPDKLPVTVLSRCLQFNLKRLDVDQIEGQIARILEAEEIASDPAARRLLAQAADGSLRDGLSLLDQAIAHGGGRLDETSVREMLGSVDRHRIEALLRALAASDGAALLAEVEALAEFAPDFSAVLDELASTLHRIQLRQLLPGRIESEAEPGLDALAPALQPELVQLWYRMALDGRVELPLAPSPRVGFEMIVLRMLAFRPFDEAVSAAEMPEAGPVRAAPVRDSTPSASAPSRQASSAPSLPDAPDHRPAPDPTPDPGVGVAPVSTVTGIGARLCDNDAWLRLLDDIELRGPPRELAAHSLFVSYDAGVLTLSLDAGFDHLRDESLASRLAEALASRLGAVPRVRFAEARRAGGNDTLHARNQRVRDERQREAERNFVSDPTVRHLVERYDAQVLTDSIHPLDDTSRG